MAAAGTIGAGFVGLVSFFNIGGRFFWASFSDRIGRRATYFCFFGLGVAAYLLAPMSARGGSIVGFVVLMCLIASMYGGGFSTIPAYLADLFGTRFVGAIHGRILTAWSVAGVVGPMIVTQLVEHGRAAGRVGSALYMPVYLTLAGLVAVGFIINLLVRPVAARWSHTDVEEMVTTESAALITDAPHARWLPRIIAWAAVLIPLAWGAWQTLAKAFVLLEL
jgi:MFS family permease